MASSEVEASKNHGKVQSKRQRPSTRRCSTLEPVLEHYELAACSSASNNCCAQQSSKPKLRILAKIRDGYVKLMNDMAGADYTSSLYGAAATGSAGEFSWSGERHTR